MMAIIMMKTITIGDGCLPVCSQLTPSIRERMNNINIFDKYNNNNHMKWSEMKLYFFFSVYFHFYSVFSGALLCIVELCIFTLPFSLFARHLCKEKNNNNVCFDAYLKTKIKIIALYSIRSAHSKEYPHGSHRTHIKIVITCTEIFRSLQCTITWKKNGKSCPFAVNANHICTFLFISTVCVCF